MRKELAKVFPAINEKINRKRLVYLDSACTALKNLPSALFQEELLTKAGFCAGKRSVNMASSLAQDYYDEAREKTAFFINSRPDEIVFVSGATEAFNIIANSMPFLPGDEIFISALEHNSVFLPFLKAAKEKKLKIKIIPLKNFQPDYEFFKNNISPSTKMLCITASSNITGGIVDFSPFIKLAKSKNIKVLVDAAQYAPTHKIDVKKIDADFLSFSGHKMTAPFGTGVLWIKKENFNVLKSCKVGGGTVKKVFIKNFSFDAVLLEGFSSFEAGIQNYSGACALSNTLEMLSKEGMEKIRNRVSSLVSFAVGELSLIPEIKILGKNLEQGSLVSFMPLSKKFSIPDFQLYMSSLPGRYTFAFRTGRMCADLACINLGINGAIRISFSYYNDESDVERFIKGLKSYFAKAGI